MNYLANPYILGAAVAWAVVFGAAANYINRAAALLQFIEKNYPELWPKPSWAEAAIAPHRPARRIDNLIFFNTAPNGHPDDPMFRRLLKEARWAAVAFLLTLVVALILLGQADKSIHAGV